MKYSLRSLFLVVTLIAVLLGGRIESLRRHAVYHEKLSGPDLDLTTTYHRQLAEAYRKAMLRPWSNTPQD
jgi:hypothetical protein